MAVLQINENLTLPISMTFVTIGDSQDIGNVPPFHIRMISQFFPCMHQEYLPNVGNVDCCLLVCKPYVSRLPLVVRLTRLTN